MTAISREQFLTNRPPVTKRVPVPEFGEGAEVIVRAMTERERSEIESTIATEDKRGSRRQAMVMVNCRIMVTCCVDESGEALFTDADIPSLQSLPAAVTQKICKVATALAAIKEDDIEQLLDL